MTYREKATRRVSDESGAVSAYAERSTVDDTVIANVENIGRGGLAEDVEPLFSAALDTQGHVGVVVTSAGSVPRWTRRP